MQNGNTQLNAEATPVRGFLGRARLRKPACAQGMSLWLDGLLSHVTRHVIGFALGIESSQAVHTCLIRKGPRVCPASQAMCSKPGTQSEGGAVSNRVRAGQRGFRCTQDPALPCRPSGLETQGSSPPLCGMGSPVSKAAEWWDAPSNTVAAREE